MKNELEILLIGLGEADMNKEKADLIDALSLLSLEIETVYGAMSNKMKECIDEAKLEVFVPSRADRYFFTKDYISHIERLKSKRVSKEE